MYRLIIFSGEEEDFDEEAAARRREMLKAKARFTTKQEKVSKLF